MTLNHKYRPRRLEDFVGQRETVSTLRGMLVSKRVPRAFLIEGPYGSGKTSLGRVISARLNCQNPKDHNPCWECDSCKRMASQPAPSHSCHREINAADHCKIEDVRNWIKESQYAAPGGKYRVFMLDEPHALTPQAQRALLKPLEDPNRGTIWILCTTDPGKLQAPIRSRLEAGRMAIRPVPSTDLAKRLHKIAKAEGTALPKDVLISIARGAENHPRDAIGILDRVLHSMPVGGKKVDIGKMVLQIVDQTVTGSPDRVAQEIVGYLLAGELRPAMKVTVSTSLPADVLLQAIARVWYNIITWYSSPEAIDQYYARCFRDMDIPKRFNEEELALLIQAGERLTKGYERSKTYLMDEKFIRSNTVSAMWEVCRDLNKTDEE